MVVKERYVPIWRRKKVSRKWRWRSPISVVSVLSLVCGLLLVVPDIHRADPFVAISFLLRDGDLSAWMLMGSLGIVTIAFQASLVRRKRHGSAWVFAAALVLMGLISVTDPLSGFHLTCFLLTACLTVWWLVAMACDFDDTLLYWFASGAAASVLVSFAAMGFGERMLILCLLCGVNVLHFRYLHPKAPQRRTGRAPAV